MTMKWSVLITAVLCSLSLSACSDRESLSPKDPAWDRDVCHRCQMMISDRNYSAQVINPAKGEHYFFDDLGCALNWLQETKPVWKNEALIYANDARSGKWVDVRQGIIAVQFVTPMSYGMGVFSKDTKMPEDKTVLTFEQAIERAVSVKHSKMQHNARCLSTLASLRSRWFWGYTIIIFGFIALIFSSGVTDSRVMGFTGLTRLLVIFIQACNLVLPVFILVSTVRTLVKERETNVFEYLLSYPISLGDYYWGKAACAVITTMVPLAAALAGAALWSCFMGQTASVGLIALYTALLLASSLFFIGLSFLISSVVRTQEAGLTCALLIWLTLIALLDVAFSYQTAGS